MRGLLRAFALLFVVVLAGVSAGFVAGVSREELLDWGSVRGVRGCCISVSIHCRDAFERNDYITITLRLAFPSMMAIMLIELTLQHTHIVPARPLSERAVSVYVQAFS